MARIIGKGYSYNDVLIVPKYNKVASRKDVNFKTRITKNHEIKIPIIAANMDTVCESEMAIALGKLGGLASGMTYMGAKEMKNLIGKADFIEISSAGFYESLANGKQK
jgi:IMP dehydrogenase